MKVINECDFNIMNMKCKRLAVNWFLRETESGLYLHSRCGSHMVESILNTILTREEALVHSIVNL